MDALYLDLQVYSHDRHAALDVLLPSAEQGRTWSFRLRNWLKNCAQDPPRAGTRTALETAVSDLVTLELTCLAASLSPEGLQLTDLGGTSWVRRAQAELLILVARYEPNTARALAEQMRALRTAQLRRLHLLLHERSGAAAS
ncbi:hypothetical protein [Pseudooceanicola sp. 200-1SW]|uniref:hypothetical protein n=1 Tax=Pseudooceanicola sp. 200-1SW TaxID=3425949 RepID=UPI003D7F6379